MKVSRKCFGIFSTCTSSMKCIFSCITSGLNLVNWWVQGVGNDLYWPPNQEKDYSMKSLTQRYPLFVCSHLPNNLLEDCCVKQALIVSSLSFCSNFMSCRSMEYCEALRSLGLHGTPIKTDSWSLWEDAYYGGSRALRYLLRISTSQNDRWEMMSIPISVLSQDVFF